MEHPVGYYFKWAEKPGKQGQYLTPKSFLTTTPAPYTVERMAGGTSRKKELLEDQSSRPYCSIWTSRTGASPRIPFNAEYDPAGLQRGWNSYYWRAPGKCQGRWLCTSPPTTRIQTSVFQTVSHNWNLVMKSYQWVSITLFFIKEKKRNYQGTLQTVNLSAMVWTFCSSQTNRHIWICFLGYKRKCISCY